MLKKNDTISITFSKILCLTFIFLLIISKVAFANDYFEIKIPCKIGASVNLIHNGIVYEIGKVLKIPTSTRYPSYTASAWGTSSSICASAVNAIHIVTSIEQNKGRTISILPQETIAPAAGTNAAFIIDSKAGNGIFGLWAPIVGSEVFVANSETNEFSTLENKPSFKITDSLIIRNVPSKTPYMVEIENKPGGRVYSWSSDGYSLLARVIKPVIGTGRFMGTLFQNTSRLRANHCGVIDLSTSTRGKVGGFQLIPWEHALTSKEMQNAWDLTQWMILAPVNPDDKLKATFPLFKGALIPGTGDCDSFNDIILKYGRKSLFLVRINGGNWQKVPSFVGKQNFSLKDITHIRIYFPFSKL
ncbi:MAG: hypothetical protein RR370_02180 [Synergistaceae bacterium]